MMDERRAKEGSRDRGGRDESAPILSQERLPPRDAVREPHDGFAEIKSSIRLPARSAKNESSGFRQ
jgi:hypothetical protein